MEVDGPVTFCRNVAVKIARKSHGNSPLNRIDGRYNVAVPLEERAMETLSLDFENQCRVLVDSFFAAHPDPFIQARAHKAMRLLRASEKPLKGKVEGWAAGVIYFAATDGRIHCGVPGLLNRECETFTGVSMGTAVTVLPESQT